MAEFIVVIPARHASTRLPGKPLRDISGKPMIQHVYERGLESGASEVVVATDDDRIADAAEAVVNLQGDEPAMPASLIDQCASLLDDPANDIATLASPFLSQEDFENPNCVKVVRDIGGHAIYFSRAAIPYARDAGSADRAVGPGSVRAAGAVAGVVAGDDNRRRRAAGTPGSRGR